MVMVQDTQPVFTRKFRIPADEVTGILKQYTARKTFIGKPADREILHADRCRTLQKILVGFEKIRDGNVKREHSESRVRREFRQFFRRPSHESEPFRTVVPHSTHLRKRIHNLVFAQVITECKHLQCFFHRFIHAFLRIYIVCIHYSRQFFSCQEKEIRRRACISAVYLLLLL